MMHGRCAQERDGMILSEIKRSHSCLSEGGLGD